MNIEDPKKMAQWLQIALSSRKRMTETLKTSLGADSQGVVEMQEECTSIQNVITALLKEATTRPLRK